MKCNTCYFRDQCPDRLSHCPYYTPLTDEHDVEEYIDDCKMRQDESQSSEDLNEEEDDGSAEPKAKTRLRTAHKIL